METDARGQLGGVETTDAVRRRLADESGAFTCISCGKSNAEIIKESEARCTEQGGSSPPENVEIPSELKMGYRDELEAKQAETAKEQASTTSNPVSPTAEDVEAAELAEGFVQTAPQPVPVPAPAGASGAAANASPAQGLPPTSLAAALPQDPQEQAALAYAPRDHNDGVPMWIDRAIVVLVVLLAALLLKIMFDF